MIGHFVNILTPEEEDRVLTTPLCGMMSSQRSAFRPQGCLLQIVDDVTLSSERRFGRMAAEIHHSILAEDRFGINSLNYKWDARMRFMGRHHVGHKFDQLCGRFGVERIGRVIRERIIKNRIHRALSQSGVCHLQEVGR